MYQIEYKIEDFMFLMEWGSDLLDRHLLLQDQQNKLNHSLKFYKISGNVSL